MRILYVISLLLTGFVASAQKNILLEQSFWKENPTLDRVKATIEAGNDPLAYTPATYDATTYAINNGASNEIVKYLLSLPGIHPGRLTHDGRIYLHWASSKGNAELVEWLLTKGSDMHLEDNHGSTPIVYAASAGQPNTAVYDAFFKAGLNPAHKYKGGATLIMLSIPNDKDLKLATYFSGKGLSLYDKDDEGNTVFDYAARSGNIALLELLLSKNVKYTNAAILMAAQATRRTTNTIDVFKYLVEELKLNPAAINGAGENALHILARKNNQLNIIQYLLDKKVNPNQIDSEGNNPLFYAAAGNALPVIQLLLAQTKDINLLNKKGESALSNAVKTAAIPTISLLLDKGANINVIDKAGNSLAFHLLQSFRPNAIELFNNKLSLLKQRGLDVLKPEQDGSTLLHMAVAKNDLELLKLVSAEKIDVNAKNKEGLTALHRAAMVSKDDVILKYLISIGAKKDIKTEFDESAYDLASENELLTDKNISIDFLK